MVPAVEIVLLEEFMERLYSIGMVGDSSRLPACCNCAFSGAAGYRRRSVFVYCMGIKG